MREDVVVTAERVPEPQESTPAAVSVLTPDFSGDLVPYYFPAAGLTARLGLEWSFR